MNKNILNDISKVKRTSPAAASAAQGVVRLARGIILKQGKNINRQAARPKPRMVSDWIALASTSSGVDKSPPSFEKALVQTYPILIVLILLAVSFFN